MRKKKEHRQQMNYFKSLQKVVREVLRSTAEVATSENEAACFCKTQKIQPKNISYKG